MTIGPRRRVHYHNAQTARVEARTDEGMCGEADERER